MASSSIDVAGVNGEPDTSDIAFLFPMIALWK
jgi:hypothetical protein